MGLIHVSRRGRARSRRKGAEGSSAVGDGAEGGRDEAEGCETPSTATSYQVVPNACTPKPW